MTCDGKWLRILGLRPILTLKGGGELKNTQVFGTEKVNKISTLLIYNYSVGHRARS